MLFIICVYVALLILYQYVRIKKSIYNIITITTNSDKAKTNFCQSFQNKQVFERLDNNNDDPNHNYQILEESLINSHNECFPTRVVKFNRKRHKISPWMTNGILKSRNHRNRLYKNLKQYKPDSFMYTEKQLQFNRYRNELKKTITRAKRSHYQDSEISKPLTIIINQSLKTGIFPDALKVAKVKPLFKKGDNCCLNNYRPISVLPTISKIFERVMYIQLYTFFNVNNLLSEQQYGFRSQHSTELACIKLVDYILKEMDNIRDMKIPTSIFLDLSKAFDTLNFDILLCKLKYYGIDGISLNLIKSYLTNRFQYVQFENSESGLREIKTGIPQGSILGPLFFSIVINDLVNSSTKFRFLMYADDTTIYFNLDDFPLVNREFEINCELEKVNTWLKLNKLSINVDKTKCMFFHKRRPITPLQFSMNNRAIDVVENFNYLGIILDANMSWKSHIAMVRNKLSRINGILHRLKYLYPQNILVTIYKSLFIPHINYGSLLWGQVGKSLDTIQKKAIRTITYSHYIAHSEPLLKELNLLKVQDLFQLKILKFLFKLYHNKLPPYFNIYRSDLKKIETPYSLRPHPLPVPRVSHVYAEAGMVYKLVIMQNKISVSDNLISRRIHDQSFSLTGFNQLVIKDILDSYSYMCVLDQCRTCGRT